MDDGLSEGELYILRRYIPYQGNVIEDEFMWQAVNSLVRRGLAFTYNSDRIKTYFRLTDEGMAVWNLMHASDPKSTIVAEELAAITRQAFRAALNLPLNPQIYKTTPIVKPE